MKQISRGWNATIPEVGRQASAADGRPQTLDFRPQSSDSGLRTAKALMSAGRFCDRGSGADA